MDVSAFIALSASPSSWRPTTASKTVRTKRNERGRDLLLYGQGDRGPTDEDDLHVAGVLVEETTPARLGLLLG